MVLKGKGYSIHAIAQALGRNAGTISRELKRNALSKKSGRDGMVYQSSSAHLKSKNRRRQTKYAGMKVYGNDQLKDYVIWGLKKGWSPKAIAGRMKQQGKLFYASQIAIYQFLYSPYGQKYCRYLLSKRYHRKKKKGSKDKRSLIPNKISIHQRPDRGNSYGHIEADTILSGRKTKSTWALSTVYDYQSMYIDARKIPSLSPKHHTNALLSMLKKFKTISSITQDNGHENIRHETVKERLNTNTFFCDPHAPWQKPGIENANKLIRRLIPKGSNIADYATAFIRSYITKLNNTPRKKLDWRTPHEVNREEKLLKKQNKQKSPSVALGG